MPTPQLPLPAPRLETIRVHGKLSASFMSFAGEVVERAAPRFGIGELSPAGVPIYPLFQQPILQAALAGGPKVIPKERIIMKISVVAR